MMNPAPAPDAPRGSPIPRLSARPPSSVRLPIRYVAIAVTSSVLGAVLAVGALNAFRGKKSDGGDQAGMSGMTESIPGPPAGAGAKAVYISSAKQQLIGVRSSPVERRAVDATLRTVGTLRYDETRVTEIHTRVAGWVERLFIDYVGKPVRRGQPLFSIYSPDLVTAQNDFAIALRAVKRLGAASAEAKASADALLEASRQRLKRWNVADADIQRLEQTGQASRTLTVYSPFDGVVLERNTFAGQYVTADTNTFKIGDLSTIWVIGQAFEYETDRVRVGQAIEVEFPYGASSQPITTKIDFIYPDVDPQTRRIRFRASIPNPKGQLKPESYVTVTLRGASEEVVAVPKEAVIDTGDRKYSIVSLPNGYFDPRDVVVGPAAGNFYAVVSGLSEGDQVVTSAQFLVDSETNLMAAMQNMAMTMPGMVTGSSKEKGAAEHKGMDMSKPPGVGPDAGTDAGHGMPGMPGMPGMAPESMPPSAPPPPPSTHPERAHP